MKFYLKNNVFDESLDRIRRLFDEFDEVVVSSSGGKDSTVAYNLTKMVATEKNRLPLKIFFLDQEAEWNATIEYMREVMAESDPMWLQIPFRIANSISKQDNWLQCWKPGLKWMRQKEKSSFKKNIYGTDDFHDMFAAVMKHHFPNKSVAMIRGLRAAESPARFMALTSSLTYQDITWGNSLTKELNHYAFDPIYDWNFDDIWKAIHDNKWSYNRIYDKFHQFGLPFRKFRVSNLNHENAINHLYLVKELEPETWDLITERLQGVNQIIHSAKNDIFMPEKLPFMFRNWLEYRDYLTEKLLPEEHVAKFQKKWRTLDSNWRMMPNYEVFVKEHVRSVLNSDYEFSAIKAYMYRPNYSMASFMQWSKGKDIAKLAKYRANNIHLEGIDFKKPYRKEFERLKRIAK